MKKILIGIICFTVISCSKTIKVIEPEITVEAWYQSNGIIRLVNVGDGSDFKVESSTDEGNWYWCGCATGSSIEIFNK